MTRLIEWVSGIIAFMAAWYAFVQYESLLPPPYDFHAWLIPCYVLFCFGLYSLIVVLYRVYTFNDCSDAAEELKMQIKAAKEDLGSKGFIFD